jgi:hypothetical protein
METGNISGYHGLERSREWLTNGYRVFFGANKCSQVNSGNGCEIRHVGPHPPGADSLVEKCKCSQVFFFFFFFFWYWGLNSGATP